VRALTLRSSRRARLRRAFPQRAARVSARLSLIVSRHQVAMRHVMQATRAAAVWLLILCSVASLLSLPAFIVGRSGSNWFVWDYLAVYVPPLLWIALCALRVGPQSLSNAIELFGLVVLMPVLVSIRVFASSYIPLEPSLASVAIFVFGLIAALAVRLAMPVLPE
jgi:hypothetical protein